MKLLSKLILATLTSTVVMSAGSISHAGDATVTLNGTIDGACEVVSGNTDESINLGDLSSDSNNTLTFTFDCNVLQTTGSLTSQNGGLLDSDTDIRIHYEASFSSASGDIVSLDTATDGTNTITEVFTGTGGTEDYDLSINTSATTTSSSGSYEDVLTVSLNGN